MDESVDYVEQIDQICEAYYEDVYQYCFYFTNNRADAEDLTQETFMKVLKSLPSFQQRSHLKTWVLSLAKNTAIDYYRRKKIIQFIPDLFLENKPSETGLPEQSLSEKEEWQEIHEALLTLKPALRNVVILRGLKELSIKETADVLNIKESKVRVDYHRGIKQLKEQLSSSQGRLLLNEHSG